MAIAVIRVKRVALIVDDPPKFTFWIEPDLVVNDDSGIASRRAIRVTISIACLPYRPSCLIDYTNFVSIKGPLGNEYE